MNSWLSFFKSNKNLVTFGFLLTFFSSFGQTFMVSLFVPEILRSFEKLTNASFGSLYAAATVVSAFSLPWLGRFIDVTDLRKFSWLVIGGMVISLLVLSQANHLIVLGIGLWGIRLAGQGLMTHTAVTTMARYFDHVRGKAISITSLGHPAGSAVFPLIIAVLIQEFGWRYTLIGSAVFISLLLPPLLSYLLRGTETGPAVFRSKEEEKNPSSGKIKKGTAPSPSYRQLMGSKTFWLIAPGAIAIPFLNTAFFFYQIPLAEAKGWSTEWVAASFTGYAVAGALCMLFAGALIDRLSAGRLFPFFLFPLLGALGLVIFFDSPWITPVYLVLIGISNGFGNPIKSALQAEVFGVAYLGTVRSLFTALMVISTAIGPAAIGFLLDAGFSYEEAFSFAAIYLLLTILWNFRILSKKQLTQ